MNVMDKLIRKIKKTNNPTVIGLDPRYDMLPESVKSKYGVDNKGICDACLEYNKALIDSVCDIIPAVKPQAAFYEALGINGIKLLKETCDYAKKKDMIVILDAKRGDIGSTSKAYSTAYLAERRNLFRFSNS
jgi:orotidine-5'-phosphate decarboxylase